MGEYLPGELQDRLRELRDARGIKSQEKLADLVGVTRSTYGRVENGQTKTISSDMLIKLAKFYNVPTDYILGLSDTPENTGYDIKELGLSVEAAKNLYTKKVDPNVASLLLANDKFAGVTKLVATYFSGTMASMFNCESSYPDNAGVPSRGSHNQTVSEHLSYWIFFRKNSSLLLRTREWVSAVMPGLFYVPTQYNR